MHPHADSISVDSGFDALGYGYVNMQAQPGTISDGERELWCAVIAQAFVDIGVIVPQGSDGMGKAQRPDRRRFDDALRWLLRDKSDFAYICDLAGVSPWIIRRAALAWYQRLVGRP